MAGKYIYRLDDITPGMDWDKFWKYINLFKKHGVKPLLGLVPDNKDPDLIIGEEKIDFWEVMISLQDQRLVEFAQHGYQHVYVTAKTGILSSDYGYLAQSEFVGLPYEEQYNKIKSGKEILEGKGIFTDVWMAPSHSFDELTLQVISDLGFRYITDGLGYFPYKMRGLLMVPQQLWYPEKFLFGIFTLCIHANTPDDLFFEALDTFLGKNAGNNISFNDIKRYTPGRMDAFANRIFKASSLLNKKSEKPKAFFKKIAKQKG